MLVIEHLDGKQDYELRLLMGKRRLERLLAWLAGETEAERAALIEAPVTLQPGQAEALMHPAGPKGGRVGR